MRLPFTRKIFTPPTARPKAAITIAIFLTSPAKTDTLVGTLKKVSTWKINPTKNRIIAGI
jgi:hypothetical protein